MTAKDSAPAPGAAKISRRALLLGTGTGVAAGALGASAAWTATGLDRGTPSPQATPTAMVPVAAAGMTQGGVARPPIPQSHCIVAVANLDRGALESSLLALGMRILRLTDSAHPDTTLSPDGAGDLTVTVGLGPDAFAASAHPHLASAVSLPLFGGDDAMPAGRRGGDLVLSVNASDPGLLEPALAFLTEVIAGFQVLWSDLGFRAASPDGVARNPLGYFDGIIIPRTEAELEKNVWIADGPLAGGTICVIRRFALDTARFRSLPQTQRDEVMGREQVSGAPLSGGTRDDQVSLDAKTDAGQLLVPTRAHARAAHPSFTGSDLMLRRSYAYRSSDTDHGLLFTSFQRVVDTFTRTQLRLDEVDDLMAFATPTATGAFAILPGFSAESPLGFSLFR